MTNEINIPNKYLFPSVVILGLIIYAMITASIQTHIIALYFLVAVNTILGIVSLKIAQDN